MPLQTFRYKLTFPQDPGRKACCAHCVEERLTGRRGICGVHVIETGSHPGPVHADEISLDYDPDVLTLGEVRRYVEAAGGCLEPSIANLVLNVDGITGPRHEQSVNAVLRRIEGVTAVASFASQTVRLEFDRRHCAIPELTHRLEQMGIGVRAPADSGASCGRRAERIGDEPVDASLNTPAIASPATPTTTPGRVTALWRRVTEQHRLALAALGGVFLAAAWLVHAVDGPDAIRFPLLAACYLTAGWFTGSHALRMLRSLRFDIDVLMFAAAIGAAALSHFEEGGLLLFLFAMGGALEDLAMDRARQAIRALARLAPEVANLVRDDGSVIQARVETLQVGDVVRIRSGERVPADGQVIGGHSAIDQSPITGESLPIEKGPGDDVLAGTINGSGVLDARVSKTASQSMLSQVVRMVEEAQTTKSPTQVFTQRVERWYVPIVLAATAALIVVPPLLGLIPARDPARPWAGWFYQAMAFLTIASPCALAIGTPAAVLSGIARAARSGVLVKGGAHLENLGRVRAVAFDKTGTLTQGRPEVTHIARVDRSLSENEILILAAAVERGSTHPLAQAVVEEAQARDLALPDSRTIEQRPGVGVVGKVGDRVVSVGKLRMASPVAPGHAVAHRCVAGMESQGRTTMAVIRDGAVVGVIGLADRPRDSAAPMLATLKRLGIERTVMLSGDNSRTAAAVARYVGIDEFQGDLLPEDKVRRVEALQAKYGRVAMIGDGVNDAPALARADVGIAIGGASGGTDVALETADVALMADDLTTLPNAIGISRFARRIILQNLVIALGVIVVLAPLAALGVTALGMTVVFHEGSTVLVVLNALRILAYRAE